MLTSLHFIFSVLEKKVDNDTPHPRSFLEFFKHRNYSGQNTFSFEHGEEQEAFCLHYDNNSLLQLMVVLIILKFLFSAFMQMRQ